MKCSNYFSSRVSFVAINLSLEPSTDCRILWPSCQRWEKLQRAWWTQRYLASLHPFPGPWPWQQHCTSLLFMAVHCYVRLSHTNTKTPSLSSRWTCQRSTVWSVKSCSLDQEKLFLVLPETEVFWERSNSFHYIAHCTVWTFSEWREMCRAISLHWLCNGNDTSQYRQTTGSLIFSAGQ